MRSAATVLSAAMLLCAAGSAIPDSDFRDPTRPWRATVAVSDAPAAKRFVVNAIIVSDERRVAIVNGKRVGEGQVVAGATVVEISRDAVRIDIDGREQTLQLGRGGRRQ